MFRPSSRKYLSDIVCLLSNLAYTAESPAGKGSGRTAVTSYVVVLLHLIHIRSSTQDRDGEDWDRTIFETLSGRLWGVDDSAGIQDMNN